MEYSNIIGEAIRATDDVLQHTALGEGINFLNETGCSLFFLTSSVVSLLTGNKNRDRAFNDAISEIEFEKELQRQKEQFEDAKEAADIVFKLLLKRRQRQHSKEQNYQTLKTKLALNQLNMFFKTWPLASSVNGLLNYINTTDASNAKLNIVLGKPLSSTSADPIVVNYKDPVAQSNGITDRIIDVLKNNLGISKERIHLMNDDCNLYGGSLFANIYAVMHSLPTIVLSPVVYEKKIHLNIACWNQDSPFPCQNEVMTIEYDSMRSNGESQYKDNKIKEFIQSVIAVAGVFDDTYMLSEGKPTDGKYPSYAKQNDIKAKYPYIIDFALKEYNSLLVNIQEELFKDSDAAISPMACFSSRYYKDLKSRIEDIINIIK